MSKGFLQCKSYLPHSAHILLQVFFSPGGIRSPKRYGYGEDPQQTLICWLTPSNRGRGPMSFFGDPEKANRHMEAQPSPSSCQYFLCLMGRAAFYLSHHSFQRAILTLFQSNTWEIDLQKTWACGYRLTSGVTPSWLYSSLQVKTRRTSPSITVKCDLATVFACIGLAASLCFKVQHYKKWDY